VNNFTPLSALLGGVIIGLASALLLLTHGKIAGISGMFGGLFRAGTSDRPLRFWFIAGLLGGGVLMKFAYSEAFRITFTPTLPIVLVAGGIVGFGTQMGNGCTSGHGVCGVSRFSLRSIFATATFMATGFATVFITRHVLHVGGN
jgi:uncharacterized protein